MMPEKETMRLFIALEPSAGFKSALTEVQARLRAAGIDARYYDPAALHLTLAFIGQWPEDISPLLPPVEAPFPLTLSHLGVFPEAKVLWAGVAPSEKLDALARRVRQALDDSGVPYDRRPFRPHITLGRKPRIPEGAALDGIALPPAVMTVRDVCLYRSCPGGVYTVIGRGPGK